jgi:16S rRNA (cytidine1402-2'-O)-methyltransferase
MTKLYIVPTPIGNLGDMTLRALEVLKTCDAIACEDTRVTSKLLSRFDIRKPLIGYREHNEVRNGEFILERVRNGENIALVTDAGMPGISDPGEVVIKAAIREGIEFEVLPGPSAAVTALVSSGLYTGRHTFLGFIGKSRKEKRDVLTEYKDRTETIIIYEAPHRLRDTLDAMLEVLGDREACASREITKLHEEHIRGRISELIGVFKEREPRGEFVICISGRTRQELIVEKALAFSEMSIKEHLLMVIGSGIDKKEAIALVAKERDIPKKDVYKESLDI